MLNPPTAGCFVLVAHAVCEAQDLCTCWNNATADEPPACYSLDMYRCPSKTQLLQGAETSGQCSIPRTHVQATPSNKDQHVVSGTVVDFKQPPSPASLAAPSLSGFGNPNQHAKHDAGGFDLSIAHQHLSCWPTTANSSHGSMSAQVLTRHA